MNSHYAQNYENFPGSARGNELFCFSFLGNYHISCRRRAGEKARKKGRALKARARASGRVGREHVRSHVWSHERSRKSKLSGLVFRKSARVAGAIARARFRGPRGTRANGEVRPQRAATVRRAPRR